MGKFEGHGIPGTAIMMLGLLHILRAAPFRSLRGFRQKLFFVVGEAAALAIYCACAVLVEFTEMAMPPSNFSMSHLDHIRINSTLSLCGWITLFHAYKLLPGPVWGLFYPGGLFFVGLLLSSHHQDTEIAAYAHQLTALFFNAQAVLHIAEYLISLLSNQAHTKRVEAFALRWQAKNRDREFSVSYYLFGLPSLLSGCICMMRSHDPDAAVRAKRREEEEMIAGIHPAYTNPTIYSTPLPMLKGLVILLNGLWWWVMAFYFFEERDEDGDFKMDVPEAFRSGPMMYHFVYADMIYPHLMWITGTLVLFFCILAKLERRWYPATEQHASSVFHHTMHSSVTDVVNYALLEKTDDFEDDHQGELFEVEMSGRTTEL